ncbi:MAG TPA: xanthine dehydrogenase family protein subunit M, partial [Actinomycetota bacterium]
MLPAPFEYHRPSSLDEALQLLSSLGEAKVLAGGQSLIPLLKFRFAAPAHLVDVNRVPGLDGIAEDGGALRIGALVRHNQVATSELVSARFPVLAAAAPQIADPIVRNLGTVCGSLAHADPAGDWGAVMLATGATVVARSARGEREIPIGDFFQDIFTTALEPDELVTEVRVPAPAGRTGGTYLKLERKVGDFATVAAAIHVAMDDGKIARAGIGLTAVGTKNVQATEAE